MEEGGFGRGEKVKVIVPDSINELKGLTSRVKDALCEILFLNEGLEAPDLVLKVMVCGMLESASLESRYKVVVMRSCG
jgi:hypothetical protein